MYHKITATKIEEVPKEEHFAILEFERVTYYDGYDSSGAVGIRTNYLVFDSEETLRAWILKNADAKFVILSVKQISYTKSVVIDFEKSS